MLVYSFVKIVQKLSSCNGADTFEPVGPHPTDYLDSPIDTCSYIERYEFDTPGIEAHEVETKKAMRYYYENRQKIDRTSGRKRAEKFSYEEVGNQIKEFLNG